MSTSRSRAVSRARVVPAWAPWLAIAAMVADFGVQFGGVTATWPVAAIWGICTGAFGYIGLRVLRMPSVSWSEAAAPAVPKNVPVGVAA